MTGVPDDPQWSQLTMTKMRGMTQAGSLWRKTVVTIIREDKRVELVNEGGEFFGKHLHMSDNKH